MKISNCQPRSYPHVLQKLLKNESTVSDNNIHNESLLDLSAVVLGGSPITDWKPTSTTSKHVITGTTINIANSAKRKQSTNGVRCCTDFLEKKQMHL